MSRPDQETYDLQIEDKTVCVPSTWRIKTFCIDMLMFEICLGLGEVFRTYLENVCERLLARLLGGFWQLVWKVVGRLLQEEHL